MDLYSDDPRPHLHRGRLLAAAALAVVVISGGAFAGAYALGGPAPKRQADPPPGAAPELLAVEPGPPLETPSSAPPSVAAPPSSAAPRRTAPGTAPGTAAPERRTAAPPPPPPATGGATGAGSASGSAQAQVVALVNTARAAAGCGPVSAESRLATAAARHSADMVNRDFFDHVTPDGVTVGTRVTSAGYEWSAVGENIAFGQRTPAEVMDAWMNSAGHRANILNCRYRHLGVGIAYDGRTPYWTQDFGSPA